MNNPYHSPEHDKSDRFRHWTDAYKLKRLRLYSLAIYFYYLSLPLWIWMLFAHYQGSQHIPWWKIGVLVSTFMLCTCAALLVRHYRKEITKRVMQSFDA